MQEQWYSIGIVLDNKNNKRDKYKKNKNYCKKRKGKSYNIIERLRKRVDTT